METVEQPTDSEDKIWIPYEEIKKYLGSLQETLEQMSNSIVVSLEMIETNAKQIKENDNE
tara:strand:- start:2192 stop:2371 length:180 start_codon:yes stop_codon:yes gene_type:complete